MRAFALAVFAVFACDPLAAAGLEAATVAVQTVTPTGDGRARISDCAGVLIEPDVVLTAGHCLDAASGPAQVAVFGYENRRAIPPHLPVLRFARHPGHVIGWRERPGEPETRQREIAADLALLKLARPVAGATPASLSGNVEAAAAATAAMTGVGRAGPGDGARSGALKSFRPSAVRLSTGSGARVAFASVDRPACGGDSGGALASRDGAVWGVVSAILRPRGGCSARIAIAPIDPASDGFRRMRRALD
ncbi:trypsin-like serine protease [Methylopila henanensis]|uniref:Trypsin-like serine protease n=1 Tax=Methylopila henanensis TaxID=873516 RepID=A0ABW4K9N2_9HYPH